MLDALLRWLVAAVSVLFLVTLVFAILLVVLRARHVRGRRRAGERGERWHDTVLAVVSGEVGVAELQASVHEGEEMELLAYLMLFARRLRGGEAHVLALAAAPYLDHAMRALESRSAERRANAVQALAAFGEERHIRAVLAALDDPSPYVAMNAARGLACPEHAEHAAQVAERLWRFEQWSPQHLSAMIAHIGAPAAEPARRLLADRLQPQHGRAVAAGVLLQLNDAPAADVATRVLEEDGLGATLVVAALRLLARIGRAESLDVVHRYVASPRPRVRAQAVCTAAALGGEAEVGAVTAALADTSAWVAREAAMGLLQLGRSDVLQQLAGEDTPVALVARQALAEGAAA